MPTDRDSFLVIQEYGIMSYSDDCGKITSDAVEHSGITGFQQFRPSFRKDGWLSGETFFQVVTAVKRSSSRVNSDEVSYHLHILLRYELERQLISGGLSVHDLPDAWNQNCRTLRAYTEN